MKPSTLARAPRPPRAGTGLDQMSSHQFNDQRMKAMLPRDVWERFRDARALGEDVSEDDIRIATAAVHADGFIEALPDGYATRVRERGSNFSAGQRQLLSFARALAHGADVLVLDEATSSLDSQTELQIQEAMTPLMKGRTTVAIAHRLSTIERADRIAVMDQGNLIESGTHAELLEKGGAYASLYQLQFQEEA